MKARQHNFVFPLVTSPFKLLDFSLPVKAAPHECVVRTSVTQSQLHPYISYYEEAAYP